jgi:ribonuclease HI
MKIWCDGSAWSEKKKCSGCSIYKENGGRLVLHLDYNITNNEAEHLAFMLATIMSHDGDEIITDSEIVIRHIKAMSKTNYVHLRKYINFSSRAITEKNLKVSQCKSKENKAHKFIS